jgi:transcriptional regulator with XRE-family HTH domain
MPRRRRDPEPVARNFGEAVRAERERRGWTLEELGGRMDSAQGKYLGEIERGFHSPTLTMAKRIADALEVPLSKLVAPIDADR